LIELRSVGKSFGPLRAVDGISFVAGEGGIFGLIGPNGAGKSTTIKMIVNILAPDCGSILFNGNPLRESDKDHIGYLPEERGLYRNVKISEMLLYLASLKNAKRAATEKRLDQWLERFDLAAWKNSTPESLSKGMAQKVQFIASVLHDPEILLLDEPFTGLDPVSTDALREAVLELAGGGTTILLSTHNMEVAEKICSRLLLIDKGREVLSGSLAGIKSRYARNTVAVEFDGTIDFASLAQMAHPVARFPRWVELALVEGASHQALLRRLLDQVTVRRFEVVTPSLHRIFVDAVGGGPGNAAERPVP
jgi:ABC-2 type transport system ATP-binding protein